MKVFLDSGFDVHYNETHDDDDVKSEGDGVDGDGDGGDDIKLTPFVVAADGGCFEILELLLGDEAEVDCSDSRLRRKATLRTAAKSGHIRIFKLLMDSMNAADDGYWIALSAV